MSKGRSILEISELKIDSQVYFFISLINFYYFDS